MSQNDYKIKLVVDDTAIKNLAATMNSIFNKGGKSGGSSGSGSQSPVQSLLKLGAIATGIGTLVMGVKKLVDFTVDSSPMLKAMLQLFNNAMMFIFRPIGDFLGFILRPIALQLLRFAIPFYKALEPFAQRYGTQLGNLISGLLALLMDPSAILKGIVINAGEGIGKISAGVSAATTFISNTLKVDMDSITGFFTKVSTGITSIVTPAWTLFTELFSGIQTGVSLILKGWDSFYGLFTTLSSTVTSIITPAWNLFSGLFTSIKTAGSNVLKGWDMLYGFFTSLTSGMPSLGVASANLMKFFAQISASINNVLTPVWNAFVQFWTDIQNFIKSITNFLKNPFNLPPNNSLNSPSSTIAGAGTYIENLTVSGLQVASQDLNAFFKNPQQYILKVTQNSQNKMPRS